MQISGLQSAQSIQSLAGAQRAKPSQATESVGSASAIPTDQLDLSPEAQALSEAQGLSETQATGATQASSGIRQERVDAIRQAIANGTYESPEKLSGALDRLLDSFA